MKKRVYLTDSQRSEIAIRYIAGESSEKLANEYKVSPSCVCKSIKKDGIEPRPPKTLSDSQKQEVVNAYIEGLSTQKIAQHFGISSGTAFNIIKEKGVEIRYPKINVAKFGESVIFLYTSGLTVNEVANNVGLGVSQVYYFLKKKGLVRSASEANKLCWQKPKVNENRLLKIKESNRLRSGENAPNWQGGKTSLQKSIRNSERYFEWRKAVFIRDRFTCQHCGRRNGRKRVIEADHIYPFSALLRDNKITTKEQAMECLALWNVDNGQTLCKKCHSETDTYRNGAKRFLKESACI